MTRIPRPATAGGQFETEAEARAAVAHVYQAADATTRRGVMTGQNPREHARAGCTRPGRCAPGDPIPRYGRGLAPLPLRGLRELSWRLVPGVPQGPGRR